MNFAVPADHRVNIKESEKNDKYFDRAWEMKKQWNMRVNCGCPQDGLQEPGEGTSRIGNQWEHRTIQTTALLRSSWILRKVQETCRDFLSITLEWKITSYRWWEKIAKSEIITMTLIGNWKIYGTWKWQLYQSWLVLLIPLLKDY